MRQKPLLTFILLLIGLVLAITVAASLGTVAIPAGDIAGITLKHVLGISLGGRWDEAQEAIVWQLRLPRVLGAAMVGAVTGIGDAPAVSASQTWILRSLQSAARRRPSGCQATQ